MKTLVLCASVAILLVGCAGQVRQADEPNLSSAQVGAVGWPQLGQGSARFIRIDLGTDSFAECRKLSPKFPFDSEVTYAQDRAQLAALSSCLNAPGMRERRIVLVGRADPSGSEEYNEELGMKRAEAIRQILLDSGIAADRIEAVTEGKKGAQSSTNPEYSPGFDRRVDIVVYGGTHAP